MRNREKQRGTVSCRRDISSMQNPAAAHWHWNTLTSSVNVEGLRSLPNPSLSLRYSLCIVLYHIGGQSIWFVSLHVRLQNYSHFRGITCIHFFHRIRPTSTSWWGKSVFFNNCVLEVPSCTRATGLQGAHRHKQPLQLHCDIGWLLVKILTLVSHCLISS